MKVFLFACAVLVAGVCAAPESPEDRLISNTIENQIKEVAQAIKDKGLDPLYRQSESLQYKVPVTNLFATHAWLEEFLLTGMSDIKIHRMTYAVLTSRLRFDVAFPKIALTIGSIGIDTQLAQSQYFAAVSGSLTINEIRVSGDVRVSVGIISGISIRDVTVDFRVAGIQSHLNVNLLGIDLSGKVNNALGHVIPNFLNTNRRDINTLIEYYVRVIAEQAL